MKKNLLINVFMAFAVMFAVNVSAQEKATGSDYKDLKKQEKVLDKEIQKKAIKQARKEAKKLDKEGFKTPVGKLPLAKQLETAWEKQAELTTDGAPYWYIASARSIGGNQSSASLQATNTAKIDLAGQIQTRVSQLIEAKVANDDMGQEEAASLSSVVASSKSVISATLGRTIPLVEVYRTLENKNVEVMVTLGYSTEEANKIAISAIRKDLAAKSEELAKELDKLGY
ncbi:MAG: hypothetical protein Q4D56_09010 [Bacteroides sp.]|nr:hypothetical protein [Bacteroides sp.]